MHLSFTPYGKRDEVELLLRDMEAQKHQLTLYKDGEVKRIWVQGQVRHMPFGIYEYLFPKESKDLVFHTLRAKNVAYNIPKTFLTIIRKVLRLKKIPEYIEGGEYLWIKDNVSIIPNGMREDGEITDPTGENKGWTHEAL